MNAAMTPRRKRWYRPRNLAIGLVGAAALVIAYQVFWAMTAEPAPVIDYAAKLVELSESAQPAGENGWPLFVEAGGYVDEVVAAIQEMQFAPHDEDKEFYLDFSRVYGSQAIPPDIEPERLAIKMLRERGAFDLLAQAAACPRAVRPARGSPPLFMNLQLPELGQFRHLAKVLTASMRLEAQQGNQVQRIAAFEHSLALGRAAASQWTLIDRLVGMSIVSMTLRELRYELLENAIGEQTGRGLLDAMDRQLPMPPMSLAYEAERLLLLDGIQWSFSDDGHGDGRLDLIKYNQVSASWGGGAPGQGSVLESVGSIFLAGRAKTTALANEFYDHLVVDADLDPATRLKEGFDFAAFQAKLTYRHVFLNSLMSAVARVMEHNDRCVAQIGGTRAMIAIKTFRAIHGRLPTSLDQLVPDILAEVPADPTHGGPFLYRLIENDPNGRAYLLASTGVDQTDDSASAGPDDLEEFSYSPGGNVWDKGLDVLFNEPRPNE